MELTKIPTFFVVIIIVVSLGILGLLIIGLLCQSCMGIMPEGTGLDFMQWACWVLI